MNEKKQINQDSLEWLQNMRHSLSHVLAMAVLKLFPEAKLAIGPAIENGFYYDFDLGEKAFSKKDLKKIEKEMRKIVKADYEFKQFVLPVDKAKEQLKDNPYKLEMLEELADQGEKEISFFENVDKEGNRVFVDMCRGPHVQSTGQVGAFKLHKVAGAYWRGDEKNKMLQRIYGLAFETKEEIQEYLELLKEAEKRDHRIIGKDLFLIDPKVGLGLAMWKPKGALLWKIIEDFWNKAHLENGYDLVRTPHIGSRALWETSGHWNFYNDSMYPPLEVSKSLEEEQKGETVDRPKEEYLLKPMNCPFAVQIYKSEKWSYRDLPLRWAECGTVYRYEKSGELSGLTRVRGFTQDDAHIFCTPEQVEEELARVGKFVKYIFDSFGFENYKIYLSVSDPEKGEKQVGDKKGWQLAEKTLQKVAEKLSIDYQIDKGEAAFYGPKLDYKVKDALGREWQCATIQFDFNLPERFDMTYTDSKGEEVRPYMIHRALLGSFERFIGLLIEHYKAAFPLWLSPEQIRILPVSEKFDDYGQEILEKLHQHGYRVELDNNGESLPKRIRQGEKDKIPYLLVVGEKEVDDKTVAVRQRGKGDLGAEKISDFLSKLESEIKQKK
ncbi:MAG TPA: threonine--tRNA ligase [Patescibacteria group bacterium]|nr:threonine--tRNA ligase [Patescibacteria group bacterium]